MASLKPPAELDCCAVLAVCRADGVREGGCGHTHCVKRMRPSPSPTGNRQKNVKPESVLFVPHTPGGALKKLVQEAEILANGGSNKIGLIRVVERVGNKISDQISNKAPWSNKHCGRVACNTCATQPGK